MAVDVTHRACDVCSSWERPDLCSGSFTVLSSWLGAMSVSWCHEALSHGVDVRWGFEATLASDRAHAARWRNELARWAVVCAEESLAFYGVSEDEFVALLVAAGDDDADGSRTVWLEIEETVWLEIEEM